MADGALNQAQRPGERPKFLPKNLSCKSCNRPFSHTVRDQIFFEKQGFLNDPIRCVPCRHERKEHEQLKKGPGPFRPARSTGAPAKPMSNRRPPSLLAFVEATLPTVLLTTSRGEEFDLPAP